MSENVKQCRGPCGETKPQTEFYPGRNVCKDDYNAAKNRARAHRRTDAAELRQEPAPTPGTALVPRTWQFGVAPIRTVDLGDDVPRFVAKDVFDVLGVDMTSRGYRGLDADEKGVAFCQTPGGSQAFAVITESGLYTLVLRSRKPEAAPFRRWVTHDVLPQLRRTGAYVVPGADQQVALLAAVAAESRQLRDQVERLKAEIERTLVWAHSQRFVRQPTKPTRKSICGAILQMKYAGGCPLHDGAPVPRVVEPDGQESEGACWLHWVGIHTATVERMILCCRECWERYSKDQVLRATHTGTFAEFHRIRRRYEADLRGVGAQLDLEFAGPDDIIGPRGAA